MQFEDKFDTVLVNAELGESLQKAQKLYDKFMAS